MPESMTQLRPIVTEDGELDISDWNFKVEHRTKNRMKVSFKLNQEQAASYNNFRNNTMPDTISEDEFCKSVFFMGLATLERSIMEQVQSTLEQDENIDLDAIVAEAKAAQEAEEAEAVEVIAEAPEEESSNA